MRSRTVGVWHGADGSPASPVAQVLARGLASRDHSNAAVRHQSEHPLRYERFIGLRHLRSSRRTFLDTLTLLAVAGVALAVTAFLPVVSVAGGFVDAFRDRVLGVNAHLVVMKNGVYFGNYAEVAGEIQALDGVDSTAPFIIREMLITSAESSARPGALIKGVDALALDDREELLAMVTEGELAGLQVNGAIHTDATPEAGVARVALGRVLAEKLQAEVGAPLTLVSPLRGIRSLQAAGNASAANFARVEVAAIVDTGFYDYDSRLVLMDYRAVQQLLGLGDTVMGVEVRLSDPDRTGEIKASIEDLLATGRFRTLDWREINRNLFSSLQLQRLAMTLIVAFLVIVASTVIFCVLIMMVLEKRREIAVLRSMGATAGGVMRIFVIQGMTIGVVGTAIGLVAGLGVCELLAAIDFGLEFEVYRVPSLPVTVRPSEVALAAAGTLGQCFLATLYPSWRAAQVSPAEALRYD